MTLDELKDLKTGDIIRHKSDYNTDAYIITANYGDRVTAVRTVDLTNPIEWDIVFKCYLRRNKCIL